MKKLDAKINSLGLHSYIQEPSVEYAVGPDTGALCFWGAVVGGMLGLLIEMGSCSQFDHTFGTFLGNSLLYGIIGLGVGIMFGVICAKLATLAEQRKLNQDYENRMQNYQTAMHNDALRVNRELKQRETMLFERKKLYSSHVKTCELLQRFYDTNIIYKKYQHDFAAVASFLYYFESGCCSTLGENRGGDGAYNMFETELRQNIIIGRLDGVISKLDKIKENQYSLAMAISEGNRISNKLVSATECIAIAQETTAQNSTIAAYNSERSSNELNQIKWLQLWEQMN